MHMLFSGNFSCLSMFYINYRSIPQIITTLNLTPFSTICENTLPGSIMCISKYILIRVVSQKADSTLTLVSIGENQIRNSFPLYHMKKKVLLSCSNLLMVTPFMRCFRQDTGKSFPVSSTME